MYIHISLSLYIYIYICVSARARCAGAGDALCGTSSHGTALHHIASCGQPAAHEESGPRVLSHVT